MPNGGLCRIAAEVLHATGTRWLVVSVTDTGICIKKLCSRGCSTVYTTKASGTGLGLAIAYRIMEVTGAPSNVQHTGIGTTTVLTFPVAVEAAQPVAVPS